MKNIKWLDFKKNYRIRKCFSAFQKLLLFIVFTVFFIMGLCKWVLNAMIFVVFSPIFLIVFIVDLFLDLVIKHKPWNPNIEMENIISTLIKNDNKEWAQLVFDANYVSQSFFERRGELKKVLPKLIYEGVARDNGIEKQVVRVLMYFNSVHH